MQRIRPVLAVALAAGLAGALPAVAAAPKNVVTDGCVKSVPEPESTAPVAICYTLFRPAGASAAAPVPIVFHSHGWGGSRSSAPHSFDEMLAAGFGVLSFDQRGFGESGGVAHVENPNFEGQDVERLVDLVAGLDWIAKDGPGDPVLGAMGGSYGGGFQFVGALTELRDRGATRFDALAPEITWWDLNESLAPSGVVRTLWALVLYAAGVPSGAHTNAVNAAFTESAVTGNEPDRLARFFKKNGPSWHVSKGRHLDIPVLFRQGITDNLFPLDQAIQNFQNLLTPAARSRSMVIGFNGGHALPSAVPLGVGAGGDPCSASLAGGFEALRLQFFREELQGAAPAIPGRGQYHLATANGRCVTVDDVAATASYPVGDVISTTNLGAPVAYPLAAGPLTIAGSPTFDASVTSLALDGRVFLALSVGPDPLTAKIVQNNMLPLREPGTLIIDKPVSGKLPSIAVDVPAGQFLYLTVTPFSDMSFGHGGRVPGVMFLDDVVVHVPVVPPKGNGLTPA